MRPEEKTGVVARGRDQFPVGMRVLAVDDDPVCLKVLETLLLRCQYHVITTNQAVIALKMLRENRDMFDLVISDVHMPDMDGFKLLELVGLEMDLPVIMLSVNGETKTVMKGITHGACDYLLKPVRIEELRNIWQHVIRRKFSSRDRANLDTYEECSKPPNADSDHVHGQVTCRSPDQSGRPSKKRKEYHSEDEDEGEESNAQENDDPSAPKKPRVVWSVELHRKFVAAVNQLGIDKAVPKMILEIMNVDKLTRENVESHLQKYRLYLKRLSAVASQQAKCIVAAFGGRDPFLRMGAFEGLQGYQAFTSSAALSSFSPHGLLNSPRGLSKKLQEANSLNYEREESKKLKEKVRDLSKKLQETNSAAVRLHEQINKKEDFMRKLQNEVQHKTLVNHEISRVARNKDQEIENLRFRRSKTELELGRLETEVTDKTMIFNETIRIAKANADDIRSWEKKHAETIASHEEEVKKLDSRLVEQVVEIKQLREASTRTQQEMEAMKINLQGNVTLLNNVLSELHTEGKAPQDDTIAAHINTIGEQVGTLQELVTTLKANQAESIKQAVESAVSYALAKFKAHDPSLNVQPLEVDFYCSEAEASRLIEEMQSVGRKVSEEMQLGSPSSE